MARGLYRLLAFGNYGLTHKARKQQRVSFTGRDVTWRGPRSSLEESFRGRRKEMAERKTPPAKIHPLNTT